jgi:hypothetical protein
MSSADRGSELKLMQDKEEFMEIMKMSRSWELIFLQYLIDLLKCSKRDCEVRAATGQRTNGQDRMDANARSRSQVWLSRRYEGRIVRDLCGWWGGRRQWKRRLREGKTVRKGKQTRDQSILVVGRKVERSGVRVLVTLGQLSRGAEDHVWMVSVRE